MIIMAVDPGTANTGIAIYDSDREAVLECCTIRTKKSGQDQTALYNRCMSIAYGVDEIMLTRGADVLVVEGFVSFGGARQNSNTFQTPFLVGTICGVCDVTAIQTSRDVFGNSARSMKHERDAIARGESSITGAEKAGNDHERSALCHAVYYARNGGDHERY